MAAAVLLGAVIEAHPTRTYFISTYHVAECAGAHAIAFGVCKVAIGDAARDRGGAWPTTDNATTSTIEYNAGLGGAGTTAWMPNGTALQVHFLAIAEWIATLGAAGTGWMEVVVVASLEHLATDEPIAVGALDAKALLVALLAVRHRILTHILAI